MPMGKYERTKEHNRKLAEALSNWRNNVGFTQEIRKKMSIAKMGVLKIDIEREKLYNLYINEKKTAKECSNYFGCSEGCIVRRLKLYNIKQRNNSESKTKELNPMWGIKPSAETLKLRISKIKGHKAGIVGINFLKSRKGKTLEEFYGKEKAEKIKTVLKEARKKQITPIKDTKIEVKIQEFLKLLNIEFFTHQYTKEITHAYQCDILIPSTRTIIECDGDYWHGNPIKYPILSEKQILQKEKDEIRTKELIEKGYKVIRLWECDIKALDLNKFQEILI